VQAAEFRDVDRSLHEGCNSPAELRNATAKERVGSWASLAGPTARKRPVRVPS